MKRCLIHVLAVLSVAATAFAGFDVVPFSLTVGTNGAARTVAVDSAFRYGYVEAVEFSTLTPGATCDVFIATSTNAAWNQSYQIFTNAAVVNGAAYSIKKGDVVFNGAAVAPTNMTRYLLYQDLLYISAAGNLTNAITLKCRVKLQAP